MGNSLRQKRGMNFEFEFISEIGFIIKKNLGHESEDQVGSLDEKAQISCMCILRWFEVSPITKWSGVGPTNFSIFWRASVVASTNTGSNPSGHHICCTDRLTYVYLQVAWGASTQMNIASTGWLGHI
jgi:hypothetical protein